MAVADLGSHSGFLMRMVSNCVSQAFARRVGREGVTVAEWTLMRTLYDADGAAPTSLARHMGLSKAAVSKLADRLVSKGLVDRRDNPGDKRAQSLSLTAEGREKIPVLAAIADANDADFFNVLSTQDRARLRSLLRTLISRHGINRIPVD
ncbi:MarR family winged helix-turn-helix transcriptional regulator [Sphingomonas colocasiae]|uniref:MarR family transcriptional regulator n=1 Tax=Sphingomonas colocasiae TaxID=1848973 RepID=A0ABS7PQ07_9SPHN|nr:MarR family transcriptional regulator [Sphingomonas colocasiae]MBY8823276.1 MarR family transcriptional regulator [Sphingomonas colocasiae]